MLAERPRSEDPTGRGPEDGDDPVSRAEGTSAYAGLVTRTIAIATDLLLIVAGALFAAGALLLIFAVFAVKSKHHTLAVVIGSVAFAAWVTAYFVSFWVSTGQTPGSRVMQIRVVRSDGTRLRPRHALVRLGAMVLSLPLFWGFWPILTSARRRSVPDWLAGTTVIVVDRSVQPGLP